VESNGAAVANGREPALDPAAMERLRETMGAEFLPELFDAFVSDSESLVADLRQAVAARNAKLLRPAAHTLKSQSGTLGAKAFAGICSDLEEIGKRGALECANELVHRAAGEHQRVKEALTLIREGDAL
jgi:HPt (histidine-containing phosphotransfer) domain-containing protein